MSYAVYFGAIGWNHAGRLGEFYPEDMPEDWRLAFYNTQFRCVYLECAAWAGLAPEIWAQWAGETQEAFRFVLESSGSAGTDAAAVEAFGGRAVIVASGRDAGLIGFDAASDLRELTARVREQMAGKSLYLISRDADLTRLLQVRTAIELMGL
ncbi:MAG: DUF72 domain-containing protein [Betaproteobacteria bacterium]|nr:DUF72 domain-containing protein [Betaproteobacteria bacterium]